ncbi:MAG TPA: ribokinase [Bryobacteraceae bacterium]|nr:ribokinase [Bryobacteraceae bacterium]
MSASNPPSLVVVGSLNMDFVVRVKHLPAPGETVLGGQFQMIPGGKGANQACAAGKLAGSNTTVRMAGRVGYDLFADHLKASLAAAGVDVTAVCATNAQPTGVALIWVDGGGQNSIVVASGANLEFGAAEVESLRPQMHGARAALFQLETPLDAVSAALALARSEGARTILDPAPAQPLSRDLLSLVDVLTPNESEAMILLGRPAARVAHTDAPALASALRGLGAKTVVIKMGDHGCYFDDGNLRLHQPTFRVEVKDSTAAGDVFNAAFAVALTEEKPVAEALRFANAAAAISVTRVGAQASVPSREEVDSFLSAH